MSQNTNNNNAAANRQPPDPVNPASVTPGWEGNGMSRGTLGNNIRISNVLSSNGAPYRSAAGSAGRGANNIATGAPFPGYGSARNGRNVDGEKRRMYPPARR